MDASYDLNSAKMDNVFIGISGLIGAGKTTLATALANVLGLPVHYEPVKDNVYLADFYKDMKKHSFAMQVYLLNKRFMQQQQIVWSGKGGVQDRTIYEDSVFARMLMDSGLMDERDFETYMSLFNHMSNFMKKPNIIVHLDVKPEESLRRIRSRQRDCEKDIPIEYLRALYDAYEKFIAEISRVIPVIKVNWSTFRTPEEMAECIKEEYQRIANIRYVDFHAVAGPASPIALSGSNSPTQAATPSEGDDTPPSPAPTDAADPNTKASPSEKDAVRADLCEKMHAVAERAAGDASVSMT